MTLFADLTPRLPTLGGEQRIHPELESVLAWDWPDPGLLVTGDTGVGKSTACYRLIRQLCSDAERLLGPDAPQTLVGRVNALRWQSAAALADEAKRQWTCSALEKCKEASLLILDDLGWDRGRDRTGAVDIVLASRYDRGRPTIATTSLKPAELVQHYGAQIIRRIVETRGKRGRVVNVWEES